MKQFFLFFILLPISFLTRSQENYQRLSKNVCNCLSEYESLYDDSSLINHCFQLAIKQTEGMPKSKGQLEKIIIKADYNLQKNCDKYLTIRTRMDPSKGDWKRLDSNLNTHLDSLQCMGFTNHKALYYLEHSGDTTGLVIKNGLWLDQFKDGTYSKCKFSWKSACDFELEFIKSNNNTRKNSGVGEMFYYRIINKEVNYYLLTYHYGSVMGTFKVYFLD